MLPDTSNRKASETRRSSLAADCAAHTTSTPVVGASLTPKSGPPSAPGAATLAAAGGVASAPSSPSLTGPGPGLASAARYPSQEQHAAADREYANVCALSRQ